MLPFDPNATSAKMAHQPQEQEEKFGSYRQLTAAAHLSTYRERIEACGGAIHPVGTQGLFRVSPSPAPQASPAARQTPPVPAATQHNRNTRLLSLPAELRNNIYEFVFISDRDIIMPARSQEPPQPIPKEPGLLSTCAQIRNEALKIYYCDKRFRFLVPNFDAQNYIAWTAAAPQIRKKISVGLRLVELQGKSFWPNLLLWLEALFYKKVRTGPSPIGAANQEWKVAGHMVYLLRKCRAKGMDWEETKGCLEIARDVAAVHSPRWEQ